MGYDGGVVLDSSLCFFNLVSSRVCTISLSCPL